KHDFLEQIVFHARLVEENNIKSAVLAYNYTLGGDENEGHALVICGYRFGNFDNKDGNEYVIRLYDNGNQNGYRYMYIDENYEWFTFQDNNLENADKHLEDIWKDMRIYTGYEVDKDGLKLPGNSKQSAKTVNTSSILKAPARAIEDKEETTSGHTNIRVSSNQPFTITNALGKKLEFDGENLEGDMPVYDFITTHEEGMFIIETDASESFTADGFDGSIKFIAEAGGNSYLAKVSNADSIKISSDNGAEITGDGTGKLDYKISVLQEENSLDTFTRVDGSVTCDAGDVLSLNPENGKFVLRSEGELDSVHVLSDIDGEVKEKDLEHFNVEDGTYEINFDVHTVECENIDLIPTSVLLEKGKTATLTATIEPSDASDKTIVWTTSDESVATVSVDGVVKAVNPGIATITATTSNGLSTECKVTVKGLSNTKLTIYKGKKHTLTLYGVEGKITWKTSKKSVATVSSKGVITAKKKGSATITVYVNKKKYATCKVTVKNCSIKVNKTKATVKKGDTYQIIATPTPEGKVTYTTTKKSVATVDKYTGLVTAKKKGTAYIKVKANGVTKKVKITVKN
ncbi:MAG: Ig-like domain-containing protein, partial [Erysipelotrichaceae bacterium]|nr:Ig-like domain-containing protein [Erysipelotrichaceae bacterium]